MRLSRFALFLLPLLSLTGCQEEIVPEQYLPTNAHEAYAHSLEQANLAETALGRDWIDLSQEALREAVPIRSPFEEVFYVNPADAFAVGYRFEAVRGERIELEVQVTGEESTRIFIDLFRETDSASEKWLLIASADREERRLEFEPLRDNQYLLRLQPELLRGGLFRVTIRKVATMAFPVSGRSSRSILSYFGDPRDGGRREHHGVDVFAPRHTPVLAATDSYVRRVEEGEVGGLVIWLWDPVRRLSLYYAHLQSQDVTSNQLVKRGQPIGTVGNTGNARTTHPHLHFGIYARGEGPIDPYHYIHQTDDKPEPVETDLQILGDWVRSKVKDVAIRSSWGSRAEDEFYLDQYAPIKVMAASRRMYRVMAPGGRTGYVFARSVEPAGEAISRQETKVSRPVREKPLHESVAMEWVPSGDEFQILGRHEDYWMVRTQQGRTGWMEIFSETATTLSSE